MKRYSSKILRDLNYTRCQITRACAHRLLSRAKITRRFVSWIARFFKKTFRAIDHDQVSTNRGPELADIQISGVPLTSRPPRYLSQPFSRILSPKISRNLSKPGLPLSADKMRNAPQLREIDSAIYYHFIHRPTVPPVPFVRRARARSGLLPFDNISSSVV